MSRARVATVGPDVSQNRQQAKGGLSVTTLMIASASSLAAALVVSRLWGGGTLIGAAMTPVIVALVSEGLNRPAKVIGTVRQTRTGRFDPVAEGRAGLREGDLARARHEAPAAAVAERRVHRASGRDPGERRGLSLRLPRPRMVAAIATGLVAFAIAAVFLTGGELVLGKSVASSSKRTTLVPVRRSSAPDTKKDKTDTTTTPTTGTTTTPTTTTTTTPPGATTPAPSTTTPTVAPQQQTAPVAPPTTTAPPGATPTTPAAPAPAPQGAAPTPTAP